MLRGLLLGTSKCPETNAEVHPWREALLVTPRHAIRTQWNELALQLHCRRAGSVFYQFHAEDTMEGRELTLSERWAVARNMYKDDSHSGRLRREGGLPPVVELAVGSKVIITTNLDTDIDVANGAQGQIVALCVTTRRSPGPDDLLPNPLPRPNTPRTLRSPPVAV
ncbi:uncharacterized protein EI90DRAFT_480886 [Cantharellus anzutake]|uniref:uncharacterized protein n=1 Tax=Cantharellus anzutake TaxID=1750568 RepID=UPI00190888EB|nr:uncharacterized protein EI90DRAFT_480886 [Cantharellus anzutake]KAF8313899.1 hypothetical protein EI90DRAFT_480886 [Cantharellus anzutake]